MSMYYNVVQHSVSLEKKTYTRDHIIYTWELGPTCRPVYIESHVCVVKEAVMCSFKY